MRLRSPPLPSSHRILSSIQFRSLLGGLHGPSPHHQPLSSPAQSTLPAYLRCAGYFALLALVLVAGASADHGYDASPSAPPTPLPPGCEPASCLAVALKYCNGFAKLVQEVRAPDRTNPPERRWM